MMVASVELVLERGERLELLVDKTDNLQQQVCYPFGTRVPGMRQETWHTSG